MESFQFLMSGFAIALQPTNLMFALLGCVMGTLVGVLPGLGSVAATAILIPVTFVLEPTPAIIMLAAIYYGSMYGGTITSVLVNVPGEGSSAITCIEGYQMAKVGRAGAALAVSAIGSFVGGTGAMMGLVLVALPLTSLALMFGPPESFALIVVGLSLVIGLTGKSLVRGLLSAGIGLLIATVGIDPGMGLRRFTFGQLDLLDGISFVPVAMGTFGIGEILFTAERKAGQVFPTDMKSLVLSRREVRDSAWPIARGTVIGFFLGLIPGLGGVVSSVVSYVVERRCSKQPDKFGTGMIEGVAGPETANNAYATAAMIPLFTLGIPSSPTIAVLMGAFMMNGLIPGPFLFAEHPDFVWAVIASMYIGNAILLILNLPLIPLWVMILRIPYSILYALILGFCVVGAYSLDNSVFDVGLMIVFGLMGYLFKKLDIPLAPLVLTLVLGPLMERGLRRSLEISRGDFSIFLTRPITVALLAIAVVIVITSTLRVASRIKGDAEA